MFVRLPSKLSFQPTSCDIGVAEILLEFYDQPFSVRSLRRFLQRHPFGTYPTELAECLFQHGVQTTFLTANRSLFSVQTWQNFLQKLTGESNPDLPASNEFERVIRQGVFLRQQLPTIEILKKELAEHRPVIVVFISAPLLPNSDRCCHFGVLTEIDDKDVTMIDTFPERSPHTLPLESLRSLLQQPIQDNPFSGMVILTSAIDAPKKE